MCIEYTHYCLQFHKDECLCVHMYEYVIVVSVVCSCLSHIGDVFSLKGA